MKIVDAYWEKRNLNEDAVEILLEKDDNLRDIENNLKLLTAKYQVVKTQINNFEYMKILHKLDFMYIETLYNIYSNVNSYISIDKDIESNTIIRKANIKEIERILKIIKDGDVFNTDRISIDPYYSVKIAGLRYYNWSCDLIANDAEVYILSYKGEDISFTINKCIYGKTYNPVLAGMIDKEKTFGIGFLMNYLIFNSIKIQGGEKIATSCSSNNVPVLKINLECGYKIKNIQYVYIKHI